MPKRACIDPMTLLNTFFFCLFFTCFDCAKDVFRTESVPFRISSENNTSGKRGLETENVTAGEIFVAEELLTPGNI
jgi:hypothetical protein